MIRFIFSERTLFYAFVGVYAALFLLRPEFSSVDDHGFLTSLGVGKLYPVFIDAGARRFEPLVGQEYNLFCRHWFSPLSFRLVNCGEFLLLVVVLEQLLAECAIKPGLRRLFTAAFLLTPGIAGVLFRTIVGDRSVVLFSAIFLLMYLRVRRAPNPIAFAIAIVCANAAIYYKEPAFLMLGVFSVSELCFGSQERRVRALNLIVLASAVLFIAAYGAFILPEMGQASYAKARRFLGWWLNAAQNVRGFALTSDPFLMLVLPLLAIARLRGRKGEADSFFDSLLFGGLAYVAAMHVINLSYTSYYLAPASLFTLPVLARYLQRETWEPITRFRPRAMIIATVFLFLALPMKIFWLIPLAAYGAALLSPASLAGAGLKMFRTVATCIFVFNVIPNGIDVLIATKLEPLHNRELVQSLVQILHRERSPVNIFLYGRERALYEEAYRSLGQFLEADGVLPEAYDLRSELPAAKNYPVNPAARWTVFRDAAPAPIRAGDIVVTYTHQDQEKLSCPSVYRGKPRPLALPTLDRAIQVGKDWAKRMCGLSAPEIPLQLMPLEIISVNRCP